MKRIGLCLLAAVLLLPAVAAAESISLVTYYKAKDQDGNGLVEHMKKYGIDDVLNAQMEAGNVSYWGLANRTLDGPEYSHIAWVTYPNWTAWEATTDAFEAHFEALGEEGEGSQAALQALLDGMDEMVINHLQFNVNDDVQPEFVMISSFRAREGMGDRAVEWLTQEGSIDQMVADGQLGGNGVFTQSSFHTNPEWTHGTWISFSGLDTMDAIEAAWKADANEEGMAARAEIFDPAGHGDELYWIIHGPGMGDEEEEE